MSRFSDEAFTKWLARMKDRGLIPFGTAYELVAEKAWEAALDYAQERFEDELAGRS